MQEENEISMVFWKSYEERHTGKENDKLLVAPKKGDPELTTGTNNVEIVGFCNKCNLDGVQGKKARGK